MDERETAGVLAPPPLIFGTALLGGLALGALLERSDRASAVASGVGVLAVIGGVAIGALAIGELKRLGTNVSPFAPTTALATGGVFRLTRNPAYVGATSIYIGIALLARSVPAFVLLPVALALMDSGVVDREERYLEKKFGAAYRAYRAEVARWF
jgi:protein-S-isoprenylcysteine O-methyltransferase Ste14